MASPHPQPLEGSERPRAEGAAFLGPVPPGEELWASLVIRPRQDGLPLPDFADWQRPARPAFLSAEDFEQRHGAAAEDLRAVTRFVTGCGMTVMESDAGRRSVIARGTATQMNAAFGIELGRYSADGTPQQLAHRGFPGRVYLPAEIVDVVTHVIGLDDRTRGGVSRAAPANTVPTTVPQVAQLYGFPNAGAAGQAIGVFCADDNYRPADITQYFASLPAGYQTPPTVINVPLTVDGVAYANNVASQPGAEITQDIQIAATVAQGVTVVVYTTTADEAGWLTLLNRIIKPEPGDIVPSVLTSSWYLGDDGALPPGLLHALSGKFRELAARGITVFCAQGDHGSTDVPPGSAPAGGNPPECRVQYPASDPWVTSCGGTRISNVAVSSFDEVVWNDLGQTGGGVSDYFPLPSYQRVAGVSPTSQNDGKVRRGVPDLAANASPYSGYGNLVIGGSTFASHNDHGDGTSAAAPLLAGLTSVLNAALGQPIGFFNTWLYKFGGSVCRDITSGDNNPGGNASFYTAGPGWDACTGWGSVQGTELLTALINATQTPALRFSVAKSAFSSGAVAATMSWPNAFTLVLDGFAPYQLDGGPLPQPTLSGAFGSVPGISITPNAAGPRWLNPAGTYSPQQVEFPYDITFTAASLSAFPAVGAAPVQDQLQASITVAGGTLTAPATAFQLTT
jgi:kumamolisin